MPIVKIDILRDINSEKGAGLARELADSLAEAFGGEAERTWVRLSYVGLDDYAEAGGGPPPGVLPVFVRVLLADVPERQDRRELARELSSRVAKKVNRPIENVHLLFEPPGRGRVAFGGRLVE